MARRCWLVQGGDSTRLVRLFEASGTVALAAADGGGDGLATFRDQVRVGDIVVTADAPAHQLFVGEITGDYEEVADQPPGLPPHVHRTEWFGRYGRGDRTILSSSMEAQTHLDAGVKELTPTAAWLQFAAGVRERPPLAPAPPRPMAPAPAGRSGATRAVGGTRAPAAPRARVAKPAPPPKPKPAAAVYRRCPQCQMQKATAQFRAGSEHCVDCRELLGED